MLASLAIRDVVLIERLDLTFGAGPDGADRRDRRRQIDPAGQPRPGLRRRGPRPAWSRAGQAQCSVTAGFAPPEGHPALAVLAEQGIEREDTLVLRRVVQADGRSRAFVNDQPVWRRPAAAAGGDAGRGAGPARAGRPGRPRHPCRAAGCLRRAGGRGGPPPRPHGAAWRDAEAALAAAREAIAAARRDEDFLRHAVEELSDLSPEEGEEEGLASERQRLQQGERRGESIAAALAELQPRDRRRGGARRRAAQRRPRAGTAAAAERGGAGDHRRARHRRRMRWPRRRRCCSACCRMAAPTRAGWRQLEDRLFAPARRRPQAWRRGGGTAGAAGLAEGPAGGAGRGHRQRGAAGTAPPAPPARAYLDAGEALSSARREAAASGWRRRWRRNCRR